MKRVIQIMVVLVVLVCIYRYNQTEKVKWEVSVDMDAVREQQKESQKAAEEVDTEQTETEKREESFDPDTTDQKGQFDKDGEQYSLMETENGKYVVILYDREHKVVHVETFDKLPWVSEMTDNILQIGVSLGSPATYIYYYDKERAIVSTCYPESFYLKDNYVAYMRDVSTLVVTDIFEDNELYMEINRNFSDNRNLGGLYLAIKDIAWVTLKGQDAIALEYYEGEDRELLSEVIPIENGEKAVAYNELGWIYDEDVVSDFLSMDREAFEKQYDKNALYEKDILYCTEEAWKYHGEQLEGFSDPKDYFEVDDIWAIRFVNLGPTDPSLYVETDHLEDVQNRIVYQGFDDYAVSLYFQEKKDVQGKPELELTELSFIKVKFGEHERRETAPKKLYEILESSYYEAREEIEAGEWALSPEKTKAVCISNGALPKHPSQIFVRYREKAPDLIFRRTWECYFAGWIDEDHFICYNDDGPYLIHLETNQIEDIRKKEDDYDAYGCKYEVIGDQLVAICLGEEQYRWDIVREEGEILCIRP